MGFKFNEKDMINNNIFMYEERMSSPVSRFLSSTPTYVRYYNISNTESTVDNGFQHVEELVGENSPIRFNFVDNFPIYGIENIALELEDSEEGLTTSYDGDGTILPNTIKPLPGDFFVIPTIGEDVTFIVTEIKYDSIKSNNFYKISFSLKSISDNAEEKLEKQVTEKFECIIDNIGTDEKCLIKKDEFILLQQIRDLSDKTKDAYRDFFYSEKLNAFVLPNNNGYIYDKYLNNFIYSNNLFNSGRDFITILPEVDMNSNLDNVMYKKSLYTSVEHRKLLPNLGSTTKPSISKIDSIFGFYGVDVDYIELGYGAISYIDSDLYKAIETNNIKFANNDVDSTIIAYFNKKDMGIYDVNIEQIYNNISIDFDAYFKIPIYVYILDYLYKSCMTSEFKK